VARGEAAALLAPGMHGSTFGGNPVAAAAALATLHVIERDGLLEHAADLGRHVLDRLDALGHPLLGRSRGEGLLIAVQLTAPVAAEVAAALLRAGFIVNAVGPDALRLAPPLVLTQAQADSFLAALPVALDTALAAADATGGS
jgi:acetylornithine aminotransferase